MPIFNEISSYKNSLNTHEQYRPLKHLCTSNYNYVTSKKFKRSDADWALSYSTNQVMRPRNQQKQILVYKTWLQLHVAYLIVLQQTFVCTQTNLYQLRSIRLGIATENRSTMILHVMKVSAFWCKSTKITLQKLQQCAHPTHDTYTLLFYLRRIFHIEYTITVMKQSNNITAV